MLTSHCWLKFIIHRISGLNEYSDNESKKFIIANTLQMRTLIFKFFMLSRKFCSFSNLHTINQSHDIVNLTTLTDSTIQTDSLPVKADYYQARMVQLVDT